MNDLVSRQAILALPRRITRTLGGEIVGESVDIEDIKKLPPVQPEVRTQMSSADCISRRAVKHLDLFTKIYCRDKSVKDDLVFRCNQCDFQLPDETCLVKTMARKLCPDYREFGSMGDL